MIGVVGLGAVLAVLAAIILAASTALLLPALKRSLDGSSRRSGLGHLGLHRRIVALEWILAGPLLAMIVVPALCLLPSVAALAGPALDHCLSHADHALHLCFVHPPEVPPFATFLGLGCAIVLLGAVASAGIRRVLRSNRAYAGLARVTQQDDVQDLSLLCTDRWLAFTLGILRPRVYVSTTLRDSLRPAQLSVVLAHERSHQRERDPLRRLLLQSAATLHLPFVRRSLLELHELAVEQRCDATAAEQNGGDRILVAETLLALARLASPSPEPALGLFETKLEGRVRALLAEPEEHTRPFRRRVAVFCGAALLAAAMPAHHVAEHLLGHWLF